MWIYEQTNEEKTNNEGNFFRHRLFWIAPIFIEIIGTNAQTTNTRTQPYKTVEPAEH